jgi:uncharacterized protein (UPF0276 family)
VCDPVWDLYRHAVQRCGAVSTLVEWDEHIPEWDVLEDQSQQARRLRADTLAGDLNEVPLEPPA